MAPLVILFGVLSTIAILVAGALSLRTVPAGEAPVMVGGPDAASLGRRLGALATPSDVVARDALRRDLVQAGWRDRHALEYYLAARGGLALGFPVVAYVLTTPETVGGAVGVAFAAAAVGYYAPWFALLAQRADRRSRLLKAFPNAMDMLVSCLEAGLALDPAMRRVARELQGSAPELAEELLLVFDEAAAGVPRSEALQHLDDRTGLSEFSSLVNVMADTERYGASIATSIRSHAQLVRRRRALEIEKKAAQTSPKLTIAMIVFIFPALFVVLVGPMVVQVFERVLPTLAGR